MVMAVLLGKVPTPLGMPDTGCSTVCFRGFAISGAGIEQVLGDLSILLLETLDSRPNGDD
jgi:hypothetical protein